MPQRPDVTRLATSLDALWPSPGWTLVVPSVLVHPVSEERGEDRPNAAARHPCRPLPPARPAGDERLQLSFGEQGPATYVDRSQLS